MNRFCFFCVFAIAQLVGCSRDPYTGWQEVASAEHKFKVKLPSKPDPKKSTTPYGKVSTSWELMSERGQPLGVFRVEATPALNDRISADKELLDQ